MNRLLLLAASALLLGLAGCDGTQKNSTDAAIEIVVHRGANHIAPENTWASTLAALDGGATWIELDVRRSKDSVLYNLHDETLDRTTDGKGLLRETLSADVDTMDAGSWFAPEFTGLRVPRISEMLDSLSGKASVFFDVKRGTPLTPLVQMVRDKGFATKSFFWFADPAMLEAFVLMAPEMKVKVNASDTAKLQEWMEVCSPSYVEIAADKITPDFLDFCHKYDIKVMAAIQNADEEDYRRAIEAKPDLVNLDQPELFTAILNEKK